MNDTRFRIGAAACVLLAALWPLFLFGVAGCKNRTQPQILTGIPPGAVCSPISNAGVMHCIAGGIVYVCVRTDDAAAACGVSAPVQPEAPR